MPKTPRMKIAYFDDIHEDENSEPNKNHQRTWQKKLGVQSSKIKTELVSYFYGHFQDTYVQKHYVASKC